MTTSTKALVEFVKKNPGCTTVDINRALALPSDDYSVSARLHQAVHRKWPEIRREVKEMTISNRSIYAYFPVDAATQRKAMERNPRKTFTRKKKATALPVPTHPKVPLAEPSMIGFEPTGKQAQPSVPTTTLDAMVDSLALAFAGAVAERIKHIIPQVVAQRVLPAVTPRPRRTRNTY